MQRSCLIVRVLHGESCYPIIVYIGSEQAHVLRPLAASFTKSSLRTVPNNRSGELEGGLNRTYYRGAFYINFRPLKNIILFEKRA
jgi:hypothetical protein